MTKSNFRTHVEYILRILNSYFETLFLEQEKVMLTLAAMVFYATATYPKEVKLF